MCMAFKKKQITFPSAGSGKRAAPKWSAVALTGSRASGRLAEHIAQCTGCGQGNTDLYGLVRTDTDPPLPEASEGKQHMVQCVPCAPELPGLRACRGAAQRRRVQKRGLLAASSSLLLFISIPACPPVRPGCRGRVSLPASRTVPILCSRGRRLPGSPWHGLPVPDPHSAF